MRLEDLGLIGNCQFSALVERTGSVVWCCLPRFVSEPMFAALLDEADGGRFSIAPAGEGPGRQSYLENTNVLTTVFKTDTGVFRVLDFAPRFVKVEGLFHPTQLHRIIEPLEGQPMVRVGLEARLGWSKGVAAGRPGREAPAPQGLPEPRLARHRRRARRCRRAPADLALTERKHLVLTWGAPVRRAAARAVRPSAERDRSLLAHVGQALQHPAPVAARGHPLGARAQEAALLRGHGRDRGRHDDFDSRIARLGPHVGLPLLLAARFVLRAGGPAVARPVRGARALHEVPAARHWRRQGCACHRSTGSTARAISRRASWGRGLASAAKGRCASATAPPSTRRTTSLTR